MYPLTILFEDLPKSLCIDATPMWQLLHLRKFFLIESSFFMCLCQLLEKHIPHALKFYYYWARIFEINLSYDDHEDECGIRQPVQVTARTSIPERMRSMVLCYILKDKSKSWDFQLQYFGNMILCMNWWNQIKSKDLRLILLLGQAIFMMCKIFEKITLDLFLCLVHGCCSVR